MVLLDASHAFDRVEHVKHFRLLIAKHIHFIQSVCDSK